MFFIQLVQHKQGCYSKGDPKMFFTDEILLNYTAVAKKQ